MKTLQDKIKDFLSDMLNLFLVSFDLPLGAAVPVAMTGGPRRVGRPPKHNALRRNVAYQTMMKQRRRLEKRADQLAFADMPVSQPDEIEYIKLCRQIDSIKESVNGNR